MLTADTALVDVADGVHRPGTDMPHFVKENAFFLPPTLGRSLESAAVEEVLFLRDEMANLAWAIERSIEGGLEQAILRNDVQDAGEVDEASTESDPGAPLLYRLSSRVPENWIPLLPVQLRDEQDRVLSRLRRGAVLQPDGSAKAHSAKGTVLTSEADLLLYDEEVPREGVRLTRMRRMARWLDGSTTLWSAFRKQVGRGEGSSGLKFDQLESQPRNPG